MLSDDRKLYYKIGEACRVLDIQPYVLRYWETEFPVLQPNKSRSGQRVYSERELAIIRRIKELLYDEGYTIAGAKKKLEVEGYGQEAVASDDSLAPEAVSTARVGDEVGPAEPPAKRRMRRTAPRNLPLPAAAVEAPSQAVRRGAEPYRVAIEQALAEARAILRRLEERR